jgi:hypothetical protein
VRVLKLDSKPRVAILMFVFLLTVAVLVGAILVLGSRGGGKASGVDLHALKTIPHSVAQGVTPPSAAPEAPKVSSGGPGENALLRRVVAGVDASIVSNAVLGDPPTGFQAEPRFGEVGNRWLYLEMKADGTERGLVEPNWEAMLVTGAYRDLAHTANLPDLLGYTVQLRFPDRSLSAPDSTVIAQPFTHNVIADDQRAAAAVKTHVQQMAGVRGESMRVLHAASPAIVETLTAANPAELLKDGLGSIQQSVFGDINDYDGVLVRVVDGDGKIVATAAYSVRLGLGTGWADRELVADEQSPFAGTS